MEPAFHMVGGATRFHATEGIALVALVGVFCWWHVLRQPIPRVVFKAFHERATQFALAGSVFFTALWSPPVGLLLGALTVVTERNLFLMSKK